MTINKSNKTKWLFAGVFGTGNFGDELFSLHLVETANRLGLPTPGILTHSVKVSKASIPYPFELGTGREPTNLLFDSLLLLCRARRFDAVAVGGGGLFNDVFGPYSVLSHSFVVAAFVAQGRPALLHGIEVAKIRSRFLRWITSQTLRLVNEVCVRDEESARRAKALCDACVPRVEPDLAHAYLHSWFREHALPQRNQALLNPLRLPRLDAERYARLVEDLSKRCSTVVIYDEDMSFLRHPASQAGRVLCFDPRAKSIVAAVLETIAESKIVAAERLHVTMAALHSPCEVIPIVATEKVDQLLRQFPVAKEQLRLRPTEAPPLEASRYELCRQVAERSRLVLERRLTGLHSPPSLTRRLRATVLLPLLLLAMAIYKVRLLLLPSWSRRDLADL